MATYTRTPDHYSNSDLTLHFKHRDINTESVPLSSYNSFHSSGKAFTRFWSISVELRASVPVHPKGVGWCWVQGSVFFHIKLIQPCLYGLCTLGHRHAGIEKGLHRTGFHCSRVQYLLMWGLHAAARPWKPTLWSSCCTVIQSQYHTWIYWAPQNNLFLTNVCNCTLHVQVLDFIHLG